MATTANDSLGDLERRAEATRAELAQTVDALQTRVSPGALKADIRAYVRDNPLQAAAIAVAAAYPAWRMISAIPAPVLLIGAGLAMARRSNGPAASGSAMMATLKDKASALSARVAETAQETLEGVRDMASDQANRASEALHDTREAASGTLHLVGDRASETYARTREGLATAIARHPLLAGGAAVAVGSLVAAAVPVSRPENRLMGETSAELRQRSEERAVQGLREAGHVARAVYDTARAEIRQEGLTPEAARRTARAAVDTARDAMEHAAPGGTRRP